MPIEFRCSQCEKLLRVESQDAGKQAVCPVCGAISPIPVPPDPKETVAAGSPFLQPASGGEPPAAPARPGLPPEPLPAVPPSPFALGDKVSELPHTYVSPAGATPEDDDLASAFRPPAASSAEVAQAVVASPFGFRPTSLRIGNVISETFRIFSQNAGPSLGVGGILFGLWIFQEVAARVFLILPGMKVIDERMAVVGTLGAVIVGWTLNLWIGIGQAMFFLKMARGERPSFGVIFSGASRMLPVLGGGILFWLMMVVPLVIGLLAGLGLTFLETSEAIIVTVAVILALVCLILFGALGLTYSQFYLFIVDRRAGVLESFRLSRTVMRGNRLALLGLILVTGLMGAGMILMTCYLGSIAALPLMSIAWVVAYLTLTDQPIAGAFPAAYYPSPSVPLPPSPAIDGDARP